MPSMDDIKKQEADFRQALERFEQSAATPFVPGELERWMEAVADSFDALRPLLKRQTDQMHSSDFRQIAEEDPGLLKRVEKMQSEDEEIAAEVDRVADRIVQLQPLVAAVQPDEAAVINELKPFVIDAMALVVRIRKQEVTVRTWLMEAFNRERGDVD